MVSLEEAEPELGWECAECAETYDEARGRPGHHRRHEARMSNGLICTCRYLHPAPQGCGRYAADQGIGGRCLPCQLGYHIATCDRVPPKRDGICPDCHHLWADHHGPA